MTPQERQLITDLFDRLATLETTPRDPEAERAIAEGLARAPHAIYPLVQSVLVQDEALKRADSRIRELEAALGPEQAAAPTGFLDTMRESLFGRREGARGSVPSVRPGEAPMGAPSGFRDAAAQPSGPYQQAPVSSGGSFLGTAASAAAGVIGGALLLDGIRSMFGHGGRTFGAFDQANAAPASSPWGASAADSDLARQAGLDDIGHGAAGQADTGSRGFGLFDNAADNTDDSDQNFDQDLDDGFDMGGDGDSA
jgi:hypothetical protein